MSVQDLKQWHWMIIGAVVGVMLVGVQLTSRHARPFDGARTIDPQRFVKDLDAVAGPTKLPVLRDLRVYPPRQPPDGDAPDVTGRQVVTGERLQPTHDGRFEYMPFVMLAPVPFTYSARIAPPGPNYSVRHLLDERAKADRSVYRFAWWATTPMTIAFWGGGSLLFIGGVWPIVLNLLVGAGFGAKDPVEAEYDLSRFGADKAEVTTTPSRPSWELISDEIAGDARAPAEPTASPVQAAPVKALSGEIDAAPAAEENPTAHEYRGEFYPVEKPSKTITDPRET